MNLTKSIFLLIIIFLGELILRAQHDHGRPQGSTIINISTYILSIK